MYLIYNIAVLILLPFTFIRLLWLGFKNPQYWFKWNERLGFVNSKKISKPVIWVHAVSVGEVNSARPIINKLLTEHKEYQVIVTTVTPTGRQIVNQHYEDKIKHFYLPYDTPFAVNLFIKRISPSLLIIMETEIWPNLYNCCDKFNVPILLVNARLSEKSAKKYHLVSGLISKTLRKSSMIAAQSSNDANRFISLGIKKDKVFVVGNLKFDVSIANSVHKKVDALKLYFPLHRPIWIAASTQEGEDELILGAHIEVMKKYPDSILIIVPRHPERAKQIESLCCQMKINYIKKTNKKKITEDCHVYILDSLGELQEYYMISKIAFVGGSLVKRGGQNTLEPTAAGIPVLSGPHTYNFNEISEMLFKAKVLQYVHSLDELSKTVCNLFHNDDLRFSIKKRAHQVLELNKGNIECLMKLLRPYINRH